MGGPPRYYRGIKLDYVNRRMIDAWLLHEEGLKAKEIAERMNLSIHTVYGYVSNVRCHLRWEKQMTTTECEKLAARTDEWNHIYPFMEWLGERGFFLCRYDTEEDARARGDVSEEDARARGDVSEKTGEAWVRVFPIRVSKSIEEWLYEYFDVDPAKLEKERRELLRKLP